MALPSAAIHDRVAQEVEQYRHGEDRPLGGYLGLMGGYAGLVGGLAAAVRWRRAPLPAPIPARDLAMLAVATHKIARILAKDPVTSPLRVPFTVYEGTSGEAELHEEVRGGTGPRHAVGELVTCPFCLAQWVATGLIGGYILAPRLIRLVSTVFTVVTAADALQYAYAGAQQLTAG